MASIRIALVTIRLVMRTPVALFFTFLFPIMFLFVFAGLVAHGNPEGVVYFFGPVVTLNIMGSGFWGLGMQSVVQRERGSLRRYRLAPLGPGTMVTSSLLANYLLGLPAIALLTLCAMVVFHMPLTISLLSLLILVTVGNFAFAGFGLTIASVANTMQEAQVYNNVFWLTLLFLSGVTVPLPLLPHWIQRLAAFLPATYLVGAFQAIMVQGQPLVNHWRELVVLVIAGTFGLLFAWKLFRWEKEQKLSRRNKLLAISFVLPFLVTGVWMNTRGNRMVSWAMSYNLIGQARPQVIERRADNHMIENFEGPQALEDLLKRWEVSTNSSAASHSMVELSLVSPGASGTEHALRLKGHLTPAPATEGGGVLARYELKIPPQAKNLCGIEFEARGDARVYQVRVHLATSPSSLEPAISFVPLPDWQTIRIPVGWLASGGPAPGPWILEVVVAGPPGEFNLEIDEIRFY